MNVEQQVREFHTTFGAMVKDSPELPDQDTIDLRLSLIEEELQELKDALAEGDLVETFDAILDLIYVTVGTGVSFGLPVTVGMNEVHSSNMSKLGEDGKPIYREDGKVLKGPNFFEPNLAGILEWYAR